MVYVYVYFNGCKFCAPKTWSEGRKMSKDVGILSVQLGAPCGTRVCVCVCGADLAGLGPGCNLRLSLHPPPLFFLFGLHLLRHDYSQMFPVCIPRSLSILALYLFPEGIGYELLPNLEPIVRFCLTLENNCEKRPRIFIAPVCLVQSRIFLIH